MLVAKFNEITSRALGRVAAGADPAARNDDGMSAADLARGAGHGAVEALLAGSAGG